METSEDLFPLGPFPRHIWTHSNTPLDGLDKACHEIWKRTQQCSAELQLPPRQDALRLDFSPTRQSICTNTLSNVPVTQDTKKGKSNASTSGCSTASPTTPVAVWQSSNLPPSPIFPKHLNPPQLQATLYSSQQILQPLYPPVVSYITVLQPGYALQQMTQPTTPRSHPQQQQM